MSLLGSCHMQEQFGSAAGGSAQQAASKPDKQPGMQKAESEKLTVA
jgi:hypothetical protein